MLAWQTFAYTQNVYEQQNPYLQKGKYGFADENKRTIIKTKYDKAFPFDTGYELTTVVKNGKPAVINKKGKTVFKGRSDYFHHDTISIVQAISHQNIEQMGNGFM